MTTHKQLKNITDYEGHLIKFNDWNEEIASLIAYSENISLETTHWEIIYFVRLFYIKFNISPSIRILIKILTTKFGKNKGNSIYLFYLFPKNEIATIIAKIAGLPKPTKCL